MSASRPKLSPALIAAAIVALAAVSYVPALVRAGWIWDDDMYVVDNPTLTSAAGLRAIWLDPTALPQYYPMVHTTFWLERHLFGLNPLAFHLDNLALHCAAAVLLFFVLRRLAVSAAGWAAAIFAVHPVHVESVAWVTERKNVLSTVFYLAACACFLRFLAIDHDRAAPSGRRWRFYAAGTALFVAALLSKTVTASLPAALLLVLWWKKDRLRLADAVPLAPLATVGLALGLTTAWIERRFVGAEGASWSLSAVERCLVAGRALWFYAGKLVWPYSLTFVYPRWHVDSGALGQDLPLLAAVAVIVALFLARRVIGKGPLCATLFFAGTLVPALGFFNVFPMRYSFVADHFQYLASIGLIALGASTIATLATRSGLMRPASVALGLCVAVLCALTDRQSRIYRDAETLWVDTLGKNPRAALALNNLGLIRIEQGRIDEGVGDIREAVRIEPDFIEPRLNLAEALERQGRIDEAIEIRRQAVAMRPDHSEAQYVLGTALAKAGRYDEAVAHLGEAVRLRRGFVLAEYNLGTALLKLDRPSEAIPHFEAALRAQPTHAGSHLNLAAALDRVGRADDARLHRVEGERLRARGGR